MLALNIFFFDYKAECHSEKSFDIAVQPNTESWKWYCQIYKKTFGLEAVYVCSRSTIFLFTAIGNSRFERFVRITLSSIQSTDLVMDSLKKSEYKSALDQFTFVGHGSTFDHRYYGQIVQYFKPEKLSLFEFAILAHTVHETNPKYSVLDSQCYFYAALVYAAVEKIAGVLASESADKSQTELVHIDEFCAFHNTRQEFQYNPYRRQWPLATPPALT